MKSVSTSPTDSMPNTDITYFHSEQDSLSILPLHQTETDTFEIYMPATIHSRFPDYFCICKIKR